MLVGENSDQATVRSVSLSYAAEITEDLDRNL